MKLDRAGVLLPSGQRLDLLTPDPTAWTDRDLAISLSRAYRWGGHSKWDRPLSVAQHSLLVLVMRQQIPALLPLTPVEALRELPHDAEELRITPEPIINGPRPAPDGMCPWEPWPPRLAAALFLAKLQELLRDDNAACDPAGIGAVLERERTIADLARGFSELPTGRRRRFARRPRDRSGEVSEAAKRQTNRSRPWT